MTKRIRAVRAERLILQACLRSLLHEFEPTVCSQHDPGWIMPQELERDLRQFDEVDYIVRGKKAWAGEFYTRIPEIQTILNQKYRLIWSGDYAEVLERTKDERQIDVAPK